MAVAWAALGVLAVVSFGFMGIVWSRIDALGSELRAEMREGLGQLRTEIGRLDAKIDALGSELRAEIGRLDAKIDTLGSELRTEIGQLRAEIAAQSARIDTLATTLHQHPASA